jgi:hypothetical protein
LVTESSKGDLSQKIAGDRGEAASVGQAGSGESNSLWVVEISPARATVADIIKVMIKPPEKVPSDASFSYGWKVNGRTVEKAIGDSLSNEHFKKHDVVQVVVCMSIAGRGPQYCESNAVIVANSAPSLDLKVLSTHTKDFVDMQLLGSDPDGDKLTYALEPPIPEGMSVNADDGKIRWKMPAGYRGQMKFQASAKDGDGAKITKSFEISVSEKAAIVRQESSN